VTSSPHPPEFSRDGTESGTARLLDHRLVFASSFDRPPNVRPASARAAALLQPGRRNLLQMVSNTEANAEHRIASENLPPHDNDRLSPDEERQQQLFRELKAIGYPDKEIRGPWHDCALRRFLKGKPLAVAIAAACATGPAMANISSQPVVTDHGSYARLALGNDPSDGTDRPDLPNAPTWDPPRAGSSGFILTRCGP
jgi:hypothetical protein